MTKGLDSIQNLHFFGLKKDGPLAYLQVKMMFSLSDSIALSVCLKTHMHSAIRPKVSTKMSFVICKNPF